MGTYTSGLLHLYKPTAGETSWDDEWNTNWDTIDLASVTRTANTLTDSYTLVLADAGKCVELNKATDVTLTVPTNASVAFPVGTVIEVAQIGAGEVTVSADIGVIVRAPADVVGAGQYATASLRKRGTDEWVASGDLAVAFDANTITGLIGWYDFNDVTTLWQDAARSTPCAADADPIGGVTDKSGVGNHLSQATAGKRPLYKTNILNSGSIGRWDATDDFLKSAAWVGGDKAQPNTVFIVAKTVGGVAYRLYYDGLNVAKRHTLYRVDATSKWAIESGIEIQGAVAVDTSFHIFAAIFNGASSKSYVGGGTADASGNAGANAFDGITLGNDSTGVSFFDGDIRSALVYTGALSLASINTVGAYLASNTGLAWSTAV